MPEGYYIPVFDGIWTDPKVARLAAELRTSVDVAAAKFLRICAWARDHAEAGDLVGVTDDQLAAIAAVAVSSDRPADRVRKGARIRAALVASGLVKGEALHIAGWADGPGKLVAARVRERARSAERRRREAEIADRASSVRDRPTAGRGPSDRRSPASATESGRGAGAAPVRYESGTRAVVVRKGGASGGASTSPPAAGVPAQISEIGENDRRSSAPRPPVNEAPTAPEEKRRREEKPPLPPREEDGPSGRGDAGRGAEDANDDAAEVVRSADQPLRDVLARLLAAGTSRTNVATWFAGAELRERAPGEYQIRVANAFARDWVTTHYLASLLGALRATTGKQRISLDVTSVAREPDVVEPSS